MTDNGPVLTNLPVHEHKWSVTTNGLKASIYCSDPSCTLKDVRYNVELVPGGTLPDGSYGRYYQCPAFMCRYYTI